MSLEDELRKKALELEEQMKKGPDKKVESPTIFARTFDYDKLREITSDLKLEKRSDPYEIDFDIWISGKGRLETG